MCTNLVQNYEKYIKKQQLGLYDPTRFLLDKLQLMSFLSRYREQLREL